MLSEYRESHLNPSVEPTWNEVLTTYEDFLSPVHARSWCQLETAVPIRRRSRLHFPRLTK